MYCNQRQFALTSVMSASYNWSMGAVRLQRL